MKRLRFLALSLLLALTLCLGALAADLFFGFDTNAEGWWTNLTGGKAENGMIAGTTNATNNTISQYFETGNHLKGSDYPYFVIRIRCEGGAKRDFSTFLYYGCDDAEGHETDNLWGGVVKRNIGYSAADNGKWKTFVYDMSNFGAVTGGYIYRIALGIGNSGTSATDPTRVEMDYIALTDKPEKTITFVDGLADSGAAVPSPATYIIGEPFDASEVTLTSSKYTFLGWKTDTASAEVLSGSMPVLSDMTLYAAWEGVDTCTVTFAADNDVTGLPDGGTMTVYRGTPVTALPTPERPGFLFLGYSDSKDGNVLPDTAAITENCTMYPVWKELESFVITLNANCDAAVKGLPDGGKVVRTEPISVCDLPVPTREDGYICLGWAESADGGYLAPGTLLYDTKSLYAVWSLGFAYEFDNGSLGGIVPNSHVSYTVRDGRLIADTTGTDPYFTVVAGQNAYLCGKMLVGLTMSALPGKSMHQVYVAHDSKGFTEGNSVRIDGLPQGTEYDVCTEIAFDMTKVSTFAGAAKLTQARFDPVTQSGVHLEISYIRLVPDLDSFAYFTANGGEGGTPRVLPDADGYITLPSCGFTHPSKDFTAWTDGSGTVYAVGEKVKISGYAVFFPVWKAGAVGDIDANFYPGFVRKALIMSYDDGNVEGDEGMIKRLNAAGMKCSFNLESINTPEKDYATIAARYAGHEIANHTHTHQHLNVTDPSDGSYVPDDQAFYEIDHAHDVLSEIAGYDVKGLAWPYTVPAARSNILTHVADNYLYARGAGTGTLNFEVPSAFMPNWNFTCYQRQQDGDEESRLLKYMRKYIAYDTGDNLSLFGVWGHSHEFVNNYVPWSDLDEFIELYTENLADVCWNPTVVDYVRYVNALRCLVQTKDYVFNPTDVDLYIKADGKEIVLTAHALYDGTKVITAEASEEDGTVTASAVYDLRKTGDAVITAAAYDADGRLLALGVKNIEGGTVSPVEVSFACAGTPAKVALFITDAKDGLTPLGEKLEIRY